MRSSDEEGPGAGEIRPAQRTEATSIIDLTTPDAEAGELPQEPPVAADGSRVHPGEGWFENGYGRMHMDIRGEDGRQCAAKFIKFKKVNGEPMVFGTLGAGHLKYAQPLTAMPGYCYDHGPSNLTFFLNPLVTLSFARTVTNTVDSPRAPFYLLIILHTVDLLKAPFQ
jgi:hypothetical protein